MPDHPAHQPRQRKLLSSPIILATIGLIIITFIFILFLLPGQSDNKLSLPELGKVTQPFKGSQPSTPDTDTAPLAYPSTITTQSGALSGTLMAWDRNGQTIVIQTSEGENLRLDISGVKEVTRGGAKLETEDIYTELQISGPVSVDNATRPTKLML